MEPRFDLFGWRFAAQPFAQFEAGFELLVKCRFVFASKSTVPVDESRFEKQTHLRFSRAQTTQLATTIMCSFPMQTFDLKVVF